MNLQITIKTKKWLNVELTPFSRPNDPFAWHINIETINRRKLVILMHDISKFCVVLWGVKAKEFKNSSFIKDAIYSALYAQGYEPSLINTYINSAPNTLTYRPTSTKKLLGLLNRRMDDVLTVMESNGINVLEVNQLHVSYEINEWLIDIMNKSGPTVPSEKMETCLTAQAFS